MSGRVTAVYTVWCGHCGRSLSLPSASTQKIFAHEIRQAGWSETKAHGWLCPDCDAKHDAEKNAASA